MTQNIPDERYSVNEEAIIDAFFLVLKEKEIDKITVGDITKKAGIARSTFYNHYESIPVLVNAIEDKTIDDIFSLMETFSPKNDWDICNRFFLTICEYTKNNPFLANLLRSPRGDGFFEKAINMFHRYILKVTQNISPDSYSNEEFSYMIACAIGSTIGVLHKWIHEHYRVSPEVISNIMTQAFMTGVLPFISRKAAHQSELPDA